MAAIETDEIAPGLVVFLDREQLAAADGVVSTKDLPSFSARTFACVSVEGDVSEWVPMTTEYRRERLLIQRDWRSGGHPQWVRDQQYVSDGANVWRGPAEVFVAASAAEATEGSNRARITEEGLTAIRAEVDAQRSRRDRD